MAHNFDERALGVWIRVAAVAAVTALLVSCAGRVDRFVVDRVADRGRRVADVTAACELGVSLRHALASFTSVSNSPHRALIIAETAGALCHQQQAFEAQLQLALARRGVAATGTAPATDARIVMERLHDGTAGVFYRSFLEAEAEWGALGDTCPRVGRRDEVPFVFAMLSGLMGVLHDQQGAGTVGVPVDTVPRVGRAAACLPSDAWFHLPGGLQAAAWATIPGSAPEGVDPWEELTKAADQADGTGVRLVRALEVYLAHNAGRTDQARAGIEAHARSLARTPMLEEWALFDAYALSVSRHVSDLMWIEQKGHRTLTFGVLPNVGGAAPVVEDLFGEDPFGADPFEDPPPLNAETDIQETP